MFDVRKCKFKADKVEKFTKEEFIDKIKFWWNIMITPEFKNECVPTIKILMNGEFSSYADADDEDCKIRELGFGNKLLSGSYKLWFVDDLIKHEIGHFLDYFRNNCQWRTKDTKKGKVDDIHGKYFKDIADKFDFDPISNKTQLRLDFMYADAGSKFKPHRK